MKWSTAVLLALAALGALACSEPDRRVTAPTGDGRFALSLEAGRGHVRPGDEVPVHVVVASLRGPVTEEVLAPIDLVVNNGTCSPTSVVATIDGPDSLGHGAGERFETWIIFRAAASVTPDDQGEIMALFEDAVASLRIRIVMPADDL